MNFHLYNSADVGVVERRFFINLHYGGCSEDTGWLLAVDKIPGPCNYEKNLPAPVIYYSGATTKTNWNKRKWRKVQDCKVRMITNDKIHINSAAEGSKSNIPCCVQHLHDAYAGYMTHIVRKFCAYIRRDVRQIHDGFTPDARHIRESDANVAGTCHTRSAQQGMLPLDPSVHCM
jgi:hypothetical protein